MVNHNWVSKIECEGKSERERKRATDSLLANKEDNNAASVDQKGSERQVRATTRRKGATQQQT